MRPKQSASYKYRVSSQIVLKILTKHFEIFAHFAHYCTKIWEVHIQYYQNIVESSMCNKFGNNIL